MNAEFSLSGGLGMLLLIFGFLWFICPHAHAVDYFLLSCSKVSHEDPHLVEWVEFHRLQGIEKFVLYYEAAPGDRLASVSASRVLLLKEFYDQQGLPDLIEVQSTGNLLWENLNAFQFVNQVWNDYHRIAQNAVYNDCVRRYEDRAEWIITLDGDEFLWVNNTAKPTVKDYFHAFGDIAYSVRNETYPLIKSGLLSNHIHPQMRQDLRILVEQDAAEWTLYVKNQTLDALYVPGIPYGSAGVFWEYNNLLARDLISGNIQLFFDPRDHVRFRSLYNKLKRSEKRMLAGLGIKPAHTLESKLEGIELRLREQTNFLDAEMDWENETLKGFDDLSVQLLHQLLSAERADDVYDFFSHKLATEYADSDVQPLVFPGMDSGTIKKLLNLLRNRSANKDIADQGIIAEKLNELLLIFSRLWSQFYPLVLEYAVWRAPNWTTGESLETIYAAVERYFPVCKDYLMAIREIDRIDPNALEPPPPPIERPHPMCGVGRGGPPYSDFTQMGKTAYWTGEWTRRGTQAKHQSKLGRRMFFDGDFEGCPNIWIHHCGFRHSYSRNHTVSRTNPLYELRIDHHSFRSIYKRTLGYPNWRKRHLMGFVELRGNDTLPYEHFVNSHRDRGASVWLPELRERLIKLTPLPRFLRKELNTKTAQICNREVQSYPSLGELLSELKVQCPGSHPFVGLSMLKSPPPPTAVILGGHCVNVKDGRHSGREFLHADAVMCPGFPEVACVDRLSDDRLANWIDSVSSYSGRNLSIASWRNPSVCVNCAYTS
eukprot:Gregarina_sp_Poly_1__8917@NODE_539_length_7612_cov_394_304042_g426_i0_p1_GENE_NODE_539_length_7612_cov_394_304042_g426_i0NODE_539_length_7612_cov_394_304042_g426_i0_p1_ORF_typecomplete_len769_score83_57Glyco_transf_92/PF01697_27/7_1e19Glyco_tranf_2_4/PF13704_6/1_3e06TMEM72/PF16054_5/0_26_NODE_539_length_7612_cov_394_304042_g426_i037236029